MSFFHERRDRLDAFRKGDRNILAEVFYAYVDDVSLVLRRGFRLKEHVVRGVDAIDREKDLVQEVFLRAFDERARLAFNGLLPYGPYLLQIARNLLIDDWRKQGRSPVTDVTQAELGLAPSLEVPADEELEWRRLKEATARYCGHLPIELQTFIQARFELGLSQRDAAIKLGVSRRQIRTWEETVQNGLRANLSMGNTVKDRHETGQK